MMKLLTSMVILATTAGGLMTFAFLRNHLISTLLSLEFASLSLYMLLFVTLVPSPTDLYMSLVYLTLSACEGALGLSILVAVIKHSGNDFLSSPSLTQC